MNPTFSNTKRLLRSSSLRTVIGITISIVFLIIAFNKIQFSQFLIALREINILSVILCITFFVLSCIFRTIMWRVTTRASERVGFSTLFGGVVVGYMANNILPLRAGEFLRAFYLTSRSKISITAAFSTVCIERIFDVFSLGLLMIIGIVSGIQALFFHNWTIMFAGLWVILLLSIFIIFLFQSQLFGLKNRNDGFLSQLLNILRNFLKPIKQLRQVRLFFIVMILSVAAWLSNYLSVLALIYQIPFVHLKAALILLLFINISLLIPSSPGAIGVMQIAFLMALSPFGVVREDSLALSIIYQSGLYFFTLSVGLPYFLKANILLKEVNRQKSALNIRQDYVLK